MPKFYVEKNILINKPMETVHGILRDFRQWPHWSPWLILEPDAKLEYSQTQGEVGSCYSWDGAMVGKGDLTISALSEQLIDLKLQFLTPFKSKARTYFTLIPESDESTRVSWRMEGNMPFFLFFMTRKMSAWIGMDYERGLRMLREYSETGTVLSKLELITDSDLQATRYIGSHASCRLDQIGDVMPGHFEKLDQFLTSKDLSKDMIPFSIYHKMDIIERTITFTAAVPVAQDIPCPTGFVCGEISASKCIQVNHTGHYEHLGNAWSKAMSYARYKKMKMQKKPMGYEFYVNDPEKVSAEELLTEVYVPLR